MASASTATFIAIPAAFMVSGYNFACSQTAVPALCHLPTALAVPGFTKLYMTNLKQFFLPLSASSLVSFGYLAYDAYINGRRSQTLVYGAASGLIFGSGLLTKLIQLPGVERLLEISETAARETEKGVQIEAAKLVQLWATQNWLRVMLAVTASGLGLYASLVSEAAATK